MGIQDHKRINYDWHARLERWVRSERNGLVSSSIAQLVTRLARKRRAQARPHKPMVPTIVVGGLSIGGVGKTPVCARLAHWLTDRGSVKLAVVCRGWGGSRKNAREIVQWNVSDDGDEASWLRAQLPTCVRLFAGRSLAETHQLAMGYADLILVDDGFQNPALPRTADVVVVDFNEPRTVVPSGPLREEFVALKSADLVWHHGSERADNIPGWLPADTLVESKYRISGLRRLSGHGLEIEWLRGRLVRPVCGIARPERFSRILQEAGAEIAYARASGDHRNPSQYWTRPYDSNVETIITAKDAERWPKERDAIVVDVEIDIVSGREYLAETIGTWCSP
jgi:tetraacyldisaccharide 4'-kinase